MGDVPNSNPFHIPRYTASSTSPAADQHRSQQSHQRQNHRLFQETPIPYFNFHPPHAFESDPQFDFLSHSFHPAGCSPVPFFHSETDAQLELGASSEEEEEDVDFVVDEEDDQVSFITDLFERQSEDSNLCLGLALGLGQIDDEDMDDWDASNRPIMGVGVERNDLTSDVDLELGLGLGVGSHNGGEFGRGTSASAEPKPSAVFATVSVQESSLMGGLRVVDIDSDSDSDENLIFNPQFDTDFDEFNRMGGIGDFDRPPFCWDHLGFNQQHSDANHSDWQEEEEEEEEEEEDEEEEEVYNHDWEFEASSIVIDPLVEADDVLFEWYRDRDDHEVDLVSIHTDPEEDREIEDAFQGLEWEILFAVNDLSREFDDDTMFGVAEESMNEWRGNPPASKSVIETLPVVHLSHEELKDSEVTCAICWSEISAKEPLRQLPCHHYYHGGCIIPWLDLRNTCPVCRYELPTDDLEYEYEKREMDAQNGGGEVLEDLPVSYENFRVFL